jgi:hypothetical protein
MVVTERPGANRSNVPRFLDSFRLLSIFEQSTSDELVRLAP